MQAAAESASGNVQHSAATPRTQSEDHVLHQRILSLEREAALLAAERDSTAAGQGCLQDQLTVCQAALQETRSALDTALAEVTEATRKNEELSGALAEARARDASDAMRSRDEALQALAVASGRLEKSEHRAEEAERRAEEAHSSANDAKRRVEEAERAARRNGDSMRALAEASGRLAEAEKRTREAEERCGAADQAARLAAAERDTLSHRLRSRELAAESQASAAERAVEETQAEVLRLQEDRNRLQAALLRAHQDKVWLQCCRTADPYLLAAGSQSGAFLTHWCRDSDLCHGNPGCAIVHKRTTRTAKQNNEEDGGSYCIYSRHALAI